MKIKLLFLVIACIFVLSGCKSSSKKEEEKFVKEVSLVYQKYQLGEMSLQDLLSYYKEEPTYVTKLPESVITKKEDKGYTYDYDLETFKRIGEFTQSDYTLIVYQKKYTLTVTNQNDEIVEWENDTYDNKEVNLKITIFKENGKYYLLYISEKNYDVEIEANLG